MFIVESQKLTNPSLVFNDAMIKVWHNQDIIYSEPKGLVLLILILELKIHTSLLEHDYTKPNVYCNCQRQRTE